MIRNLKAEEDHKSMRLTVFMLILLLADSTFSQSNEKVDSLLQILDSKKLSDSVKGIVLSRLAYYESNPIEQKGYAEELYAFAKATNQPIFFYNALYYKADAEKRLGNLSEAISTFYEALDFADDLQTRSEIYTAIGDVYKQNNDFRNAFLQYDKAIGIFSEKDSLHSGEKWALALAYNNAGDGYLITNSHDTALNYFEKAMVIWKSISNEMAIGYSHGNIGLALAGLGEYDEAEASIEKAVSILFDYQDYYAISIFYTYMADIYFEKKQYDRALRYAHESLDMAMEHKLRQQIRDAYLKLYELYKKMGNSNDALRYHENYLVYKDSLTDIETVQQMADLRTEFEVGQKQAEVDLLTAEKRTQRIITIAVGAFAFILIVLAAIIYKYYRSKAKINKILADQKAELERLNSTKDKFFSIISHDLRSPVAGFNGISQMIKMMVKTKQTEQLLEMTEHIDESVDQLSKLLDNLLNWAMQQQGHVPNVPEKLNLKEMADDLVKTLSTMAQGKSIDLESDVPEDLELWSDKNTTMTILRNLVNNALKFTPEGGKVGIRADEDGEMAKIEIYDTGVGMPKDKLKKLFQLQDKKSTYGTSGEKGLGLGLQLVHEFMEMNNGKIEVTSEEGKGTTFTLWLPLFESVGTSIKA
ncbi:tetratricopeptide repeat-containing sensor histidine kinase [Ekhidna sp.]|uniref:ATP-binding protein n=2 Tax=unclassified Ekhidna TaxID=2632188 RepID=UPI0032EE9CDF